MKISRIFLLLSLVAGYINAGFISLNNYQLNNKEISICGERHCFFELINNEESLDVLTDKSHKSKLLTLFDDIKKNNKHVAVLVEASPDFTSEYNTYYETAKKYPKQMYTGIFLDLPFYAEKNNKSENIKFIPFDLRSKIVRRPLNFYNNLDDLIIMNGNNSLYDLSRKNLSLQKKVINQDLLSKHKKLQGAEITIEDYIQELTKIEKVISKEEELDRFKKASTKLISFLKENMLDKSDNVDSILYRVVQNKGLAYFAGSSNLIFDLNNIIGDISLNNALDDAINKFDKILVITGQHHSVYVHDKLIKQNGFKLESSNGITENAQFDRFKYCETQTVQTFFDNFKKKLISDENSKSEKEIKNVCAICNKEATKKCSICKSIYYCSVDCQRGDWAQHKLTCKKKV